MGEMIRFSGGEEMVDGYIARSNGGRGPGIIVLQEWWGLVGHIKAICDRFAAEGFTALAPDLYRGKTTSEPDEAGSLLMALNISQTEQVLARAVSRLREDEAVVAEKVGVIGFCMGGQLAMLAACENSHIGACVNFYGIHPNVHPDFAKLSAPMLGIFAELDGYASPEVVRVLDAQLQALGKPHEFVTYDGVHHAFFNDGRPEVYDADAAQDAWSRTLAFLRANL